MLCPYGGPRRSRTGYIGTKARHVAVTAIDRIAVRKTNTLAVIVVGMVVVGAMMAIALKDQCLPICTTEPLYSR